MFLALHTLYLAGCLFVTLLSSEYSVDATNHCYGCRGASSAQDCISILSCNSTSYCYTALEPASGTILYYAGCTTQILCSALGKRSTGHPVRSFFQQYTCCKGDRCNGKTLLQHTMTTTTTTTTTTIPIQSCYQCYDVRLDSRGQQHPCYHVATCTSLTSKCSTVYRKEHDIVTVDLDCEENLKFSVGSSSVQQLCGVTCDGDRCNKNLNCRNTV